jgi:pimeloyl-ACP methyl ester carboxylesterase
MHWLLLRGLTRERRHWARFPSVFESRVRGSRTISVDLPGVGTEAGRDSPIAMSEIVDQVRSRWPRNGEAWGLLGISLGGMAAADWVHRFPEDFARVVMINSSSGGLSPPYHRLRFQNLPKLLKSVSSRDLVSRELGILALTTSTHGDNRTLAEEWAGYLAEARPNGRVALAQIVAALRFRAPERLPIPALVLASKGDRFTDPSCSEKLARHWGAEIRLHPSAGHDLPLDDPEWVATQVANWVQ